MPQGLGQIPQPNSTFCIVALAHNGYQRLDLSKLTLASAQLLDALFQLAQIQVQRLCLTALMPDSRLRQALF
jgi:hypothetical protein